MRNFFKNLFIKREMKTLINPYNEKSWSKAKIKKNFSFKKYSDKNLKSLRENAGKVVFIRRVSKLFYIIKGTETLVFMADFKQLDDEYHQQVQNMIFFQYL